MSESELPVTNIIDNPIDATNYKLPGINYPENGKWPPEKYASYDALKAKFPWADAVRDELKLIYQRQRKLRPDIKEPATDPIEYDLLHARATGTLQALVLLGLSTINRQAKDEIR